MFYVNITAKTFELDLEKMHCLRTFSRYLIKTSVVQQTGRQSGSFQRPRLSPIHTEKMRTLRSDFLKNCNGMSAGKWHDIREELMQNYKHINRNNIDATILGLLNEPEYLSSAKDYVAYLDSNGIEPNTATLGRLLRVYNAAYQNGTLTKEEEDEIIEICGKIRANHEVLDAITCEHMIHGLVATQHGWRNALDLLEMLKMSASPGLSTYIQLITKAILLKEFELCWNLLEEVVEQGKLPICEVYMKLIDVICEDLECFRVHFRKFLKFIEKYELVLSEKVAAHIEEHAKNSKLNLQAKTIKISRFGKCSNCKKDMKSVAISEQDFNKLRDSFLQKVLIRNDIFQKSSPEEIDHFKRFVNETAPYDCVVDGLNVAFSKGAKRSRQELADLLTSVVHHLQIQQKSILVLGRKHMNQWPKKSMKYLRQHAHVYLTNNLTHDDPFLLYATLKSGKSTDFFSRDLMRSHAHLLGSDLKAIFRRWQQEHQFSLVTQTNSGKVIIKEPVRHLICAHEVNNTWHLPLKPVYTLHTSETFDLPDSWLCLEFDTT